MLRLIAWEPGQDELTMHSMDAGVWHDEWGTGVWVVGQRGPGGLAAVAWRSQEATGWDAAARRALRMAARSWGLPGAFDGGWSGYIGSTLVRGQVRRGVHAR